MSHIVTTTLRLNLKNPTHKKAWEYLQQMEKNKFHSYSNAIAVAVTSYFGRYYMMQDDPYLETREKEDKFITDILSAVETRLNNLLPQYMFANMIPQTQNIPQETSNSTLPDTDDESIDWELLDTCEN